MQGVKSLKAAAIQFAALRDMDCTKIPDFQDHVAQCFGDRSVTLPDDWGWPTHWPDFEMDEDEFDEEWDKWKADPEGYRPPEPPDENG
ncbi:MAG: hypothetical protein WBC85_11495, partial [Planktotalea sp.]|uniref:hypothetical protein n=1 Tax=Planktotalea sp. TaxID=2029877 RepID=UPI003C79464F